MLYLAIDQHRKQLTVNLRNEQGDVLVKRQVSTEWPRVRSFLEEVRETSVPEEGFVAILEVCGFNDWLVKLLAEYGCREAILIQPEKRSKKKTDRRDAYALGELLWVNRQRLLAGKKVQIKHLLRKHNLEQQQPAKGLDTQRTRKWLAALPLGPIDRLEMDLLLAQWKLWDEQLAKLELEIEKRQAQSKTAAVLATIPGCAAYGSLALASRIGPIGSARSRNKAARWRDSSLATIIWQMVKHNEPYVVGGPPHWPTASIGRRIHEGMDRGAAA